MLRKLLLTALLSSFFTLAAAWALGAMNLPNSISLENARVRFIKLPTHRALPGSVSSVPPIR